MPYQKIFKNKLIYSTALLTLIILCSSLIKKSSNKLTAAQLGEKLFNDKILSKDYSVSCASCHIPAFGFADTVALSKGIHNNFTKRNTPSVLNMRNRSVFFWDGRAKTLEQQSVMPIVHQNEMGLPLAELVVRLNANKNYVSDFKIVFNQKPNATNIAKALAAYERTLETDNSRFDAWANGDSLALTEQEERGRQLFVDDNTKCFNCHFTEDFTDDGFKNIGLYDGKKNNDVGRYAITKRKSDLGKFKTPGLRNIAITAPYMHDGRFRTLEEVVAFYNNPKAFVPKAINMDNDLKKPLNLSVQQQADLVAFLKTLTDTVLYSEKKMN
jgi:cytochrome c peroxidase